MWPDPTINWPEDAVTRDRPLDNTVLDVQFAGEADPVVEPITLEQVKRRLKMELTNTDSDDLLNELIAETRQMFEQSLGISLIDRQVTAVLQNELGGIELPYGPINDAIAIVANDKDGNVIATSAYQIGGTDYRNLVTPYKWIQLVYSAKQLVPLGLRMCLLREIVYRFNHMGDEQLDSEGLHVKEAYKYSRKLWLA